MSAQQIWAAADRNKAAILEALGPRLPATGLVLEVSSGSGQHCAWFAAALPQLEFQPTEFDAAMLPSIAAWVAGLENVRAPVQLDVTEAWPVQTAAAVYCANMLHIAPWAAAEALFAGAGRVLAPGGRLFTYGPYKFDGAFTAPSNAAFDRSLQARDACWGVRDVGDLDGLAEAAGLSRVETLALPANNHLLVWEKG